jgi:hypothetical protein
MRTFRANGEAGAERKIIMRWGHFLQNASPRQKRDEFSRGW